MKRYWLRLTPEEALVIEDDHILSAAAIRGAIANILLATCRPDHQHDSGPCSADCRYWPMFGEDHRLHIRSGYIGMGDETQPFLATARTCSQAPGFKATGGHGVLDIAIRQWIFESADVSRMLAPFTARCSMCGSPLIACEGLYTRQGEGEFTLVGEVSTSMTTNYATMSRVRKQPIEHYTIEAKQIGRGLHYTARIDVPESLDALLKQAVSKGLWIGARRSRGMGSMRVELIPYTPTILSLNERVARFNRAIRAEQRFYAAMEADHGLGDDGDEYFTLDLHEVALPNYPLSPSIVPALRVLPSVKPVRQWLIPKIIGGWHTAAGVPRQTQIGTSGVILYRVPADANRIGVEEVLTFLESDGIGTGRERGFGAITVCDPFHLSTEPL